MSGHTKLCDKDIIDFLEDGNVSELDYISGAESDDEITTVGLLHQTLRTLTSQLMNNSWLTMVSNTCLKIRMKEIVITYR